MTAVRAAGLRLSFGPRVALDGVSFDVAAGEVVGLLGPNGAGKTTTLSILATLRRPDAGDAEVAGYSTRRQARSVRRVLGLVPQALAVYPTLTAWENVRCFAVLRGLRGRAARAAARHALELVGLEERAHDVVATYSGGMQRRLNLACGLLHSPPVLLLDEPTVGVDPQSRARIMDTVRAHAAAGAAVLYSTHYMEEAERLCDRVLLIDHGRVVAAGTPAELTRSEDGAMRLVLVTRDPLPEGWLDGLADAQPASSVRATEGIPERGHHVEVMVATLSVVARVLERAGAATEILEFHVHRPDLEDVFLRITGRGLRD
jgi:ABC-2 type transport system ATP-binding protein